MISSPKLSPQSVPQGSPVRYNISQFGMQRRSVDIERAQHKKSFNFDRYEVVQGDKIIVKAEERMAQWREQKDGIREALALLIHSQVLSEVDERVKLESLFQSNKVLWAKVLLRTKPFQVLLAEMTTRAKIILERQFTHNSEQMNVFLNHPRPSPPRLKLVPPAPRAPLPHQIYKSNGSKDGGGSGEQRRNSVGKAEKKEPPQEIKLMKRRLSDIDSLVDNLEEREDEMGQKVDIFESHTRKRVGIDYFENIGRQIRQQLQEMANSSVKVPTGDDIEEGVKRGWKDYESFEKQLGQQKYQYEIQLRQMKHAFLRHIDWIKRKTAFRIQALETALTEVKLQNRVLKDRSQMEREDQLAQDYNDEWNKTSPMEAILTIEMARRRIMRMNKQIKGQTKEINSLEEEKKKFDQKIKDMELDLQIQTQESEEKERLLQKQKKEMREGLKRVLQQVQFYKNAAKQNHLITMLEKEDPEREKAALNYLWQNQADDLLGHLRRDCTVLKTRLQELRDKFKKYRILADLPKKKQLDKHFMIPMEGKQYFQHFFKEERLRQILALKDGQMAVGLVDGMVEYQEMTEDESEEDSASLKRNTSRLTANVGLKSRKVSGMSQISSTLKSPSSPRQFQVQSKNSEPRLSRTKTSVKSNLAMPKQVARSTTRLPRQKINLKNEQHRAEESQKEKKKDEIKEDSIQESSQLFIPLQTNLSSEEIKLEDEAATGSIDQNSIDITEEDFEREEEPTLAEEIIEEKKEEETPKTQEHSKVEIIEISKGGGGSIAVKAAHQVEKKKETEVEKLARELVRCEKKIKLEDSLERLVTLPNRKQRKLSTFVLNYLLALSDALRSADQIKVTRLLNIRSGLEQESKPFKTIPRITPIQRNVQDSSSRCLSPQSNPYRQQRKESPRELNAAFVRQLREKQRSHQEEKIHEQDDIKRLEEWVRLETKKTITALQKYIKVSSIENSEPSLLRADEEQRHAIQSDEIQGLSSSTSPLSQVYLGRSMRGKALRALPRKKMLESARKINFPGRRSSLVERSLPDTSSTDWRPITGTAIIQSPHLLSYEKQRSQEFLTLTSQGSTAQLPMVYLKDGETEEARLFPRQRSTFHEARKSAKDTLNLSLTLPQWRGASDAKESGREKSSSVEETSARYH